jgi:hypothetical protein
VIELNVYLTYRDRRTLVGNGYLVRQTLESICDNFTSDLLASASVNLQKMIEYDALRNNIVRPV